MNKMNSVGRVSPKIMKVKGPLILESGKSLENYEIIYEVYGDLNPTKNNAVLTCHALSSNHHVAGYHNGDEKPGWWDNMVGPNKPINTENFFVVSLNNIGVSYLYKGNIKKAEEYLEKSLALQKETEIQIFKLFTTTHLQLAKKFLNNSSTVKLFASFSSKAFLVDFHFL